MAHRQKFSRQHAYEARPVLLENAVSYGFSAGVVKKYRDVKKNSDLNFAQGKQTHKTAQLELLPITNILRDYVHGRETGLRTWYRLDEELSQDPGTSSKSPETGDLNILDFIKKLRDSDGLRHLPARLDFDYIGLTLQYNEICHKTDVAQEASVGLPARLTDEVEPAKEAAHWKSPTSWGYTIVSTILSKMGSVPPAQEAERQEDEGCGVR
jgi:hypothetical protein